MWLQICQGLVFLCLFGNLIGGVIRAVSGRDKVEPTGALGVFLVLMWTALCTAVAIRAGALSTIVGYP